MRDPNSTLGAAALTALAVRARRKAAVASMRNAVITQPFSSIKAYPPITEYGLKKSKIATKSYAKRQAKERAEREAEATTWIAEVRARKATL